MSLDLLKHLYGFSNGIYFTVVVVLILYGISYRKQFNWQIAAAYILLAVSFVCFGLYNIFFQQLFTDITAPLYSSAFIKFCAMMTPVTLLILTYMHIKAYSIRSIHANALIRKEKWFVYLIYITTIINIGIIYFLDDYKQIAIMLLIGFILPNIGAIRLALLTKERNFINIGYLIMFGVSLVVILTLGFYSILHADKFTPETQIFSNLFFAIVVIYTSFFSLRYGHTEMLSFFRIRALDKQNIMSDITSGINKGQFSLHYQPQLDLHSGRITAAETLIRWDHPVKGRISPLDYIPLAEKSGFISHITMWVISTAIKEAKMLLENGFHIKISINFSPKDIAEPVIAHLERTLKRHDYPSELVVVEITESLMINSEDASFVTSMERLYGLGVAISIDDYGTGFSSLSHLQKMHVHELKIDQSFIKSLDYGSNDYAIVFSTIQMARNLGLISVAEGVEDLKTLEILKELKCNFVQGYGIAKPMPFEELKTWLNKETKDNTLNGFKAIEY